MKIAAFIFWLVISLIGTGCQRINDDLKGDSLVSGFLYIKTGLNNGNPDSSAVPNLPLYIQTAGLGSSSYLYSVSTDKIGRYLFSNLNKTANYRVFGSLDSAGISYQVDTVVITGNINQNLILVPNKQSQDGFNIHVIDNLSTPVANLKLWVFTSAVLAANNDSTGSVFSLVTDNSGYVFKLNIDTGNYFINVNQTIGNVSFNAKDTLHVISNIISSDTLMIK
jgi:hypothetical protein